MPVSRRDVIDALTPVEIDYPGAATRLGAGATPALVELAGAEDAGLAARAATLAGYLDPVSAGQVLRAAIAHPDPAVRTAAAGALGRLPDLTGRLVAPLLADVDPAVRKWSLKTLEAVRPTGQRGRVEALLAAEPVPAVAELARHVLDQLPRH
jgi:hypothetical protein